MGVLVPVGNQAGQEAHTEAGGACGVTVCWFFHRFGAAYVQVHPRRFAHEFT